MVNGHDITRLYEELRKIRYELYVLQTIVDDVASEVKKEEMKIKKEEMNKLFGSRRDDDESFE